LLKQAVGQLFDWMIDHLAAAVMAVPAAVVLAVPATVVLAAGH
jgi:ABC-type proline/glycine betaine transport system permease subunit